ncbi:hypothetical protein [Amycolatopsis suaedae]|uniref:Secreted protein n=1 Tax=Amycolatopsis suaedae TaxID=2510978 RepID=A0A4Q7J3N3_9PSEU|nr:hypothetical protein [Amycolatopsis suaedae]RZQ61232.1 hypothetical protein EWH70_25520 [Amycolatopsis suaedae]
MRIVKWAAVAGAGCLVGAGTALAAPALAAPSAPQYKVVTAGGPYGAFARCPAGYTVTGGGSDGVPNVELSTYYSKPADDLSGWAVTGGKSYMLAYAVCVSGG